MTKYQPLSVIRRDFKVYNDTGIIVAIEGNRWYLIMFEVGLNEVEFKWYPAGAVMNYEVVG